jgi:S-methylmethionine-dependent homocysteine/selenocysteine methylase
VKKTTIRYLALREEQLKNRSRKHSKNRLLNSIQIRTKMIPMEQKQSSRKLHTHMKPYLTQTRDQFMTNKEKKVSRDMQLVSKEVKVAALVDLMPMRSLNNFSEVEVVVATVKEEISSISSSILVEVQEEDKVNSNNNSNNMSLFLIILMSLNSIFNRSSNSIVGRRSGSYTSINLVIKKVRTSRTSIKLWLKKCMESLRSVQLIA